jgi:Ca2+/H+ antiporter
MIGTWRWWIGWLIVALVLVLATINALSAPWTWTRDQIGVVFLLGCILVVPAMWTYVWLTSGSEEFKRRWQLMSAQRAKPLPRQFHLWSFAIWVVIAILVVLYFNSRGH